jgi:hypothetical protein
LTIRWEVVWLQQYHHTYTGASKEDSTRKGFALGVTNGGGEFDEAELGAEAVDGLDCEGLEGVG